MHTKQKNTEGLKDELGFVIISHFTKEIQREWYRMRKDRSVICLTTNKM